MTDKEVMQLALDALYENTHYSMTGNPIAYQDARNDYTIETLRDCLAQPEKEWVGLTDEELEEISEFHFHGAFSGRDVYEDIEAKLKEKNT